MATATQVILAVMAEVEGVAKRDRNQQQNFNFRGIDAVVNKVGPAFRKAGGFIVSEVISKQTSILPTAKGGSMNSCSLEVAFNVYGDEGDPIRGTVYAEAFDSGDKATAKAMSVALRTFLLQTLLLPTDEPDPDSQSYEIGKTEQVKDWIALASDLEWKDDIDGLMNLYAEASRLKAPTETLEKVAEIGTRLRAKTATKQPK